MTVESGKKNSPDLTGIEIAPGVWLRGEALRDKEDPRKIVGCSIHGKHNEGAHLSFHVPGDVSILWCRPGDGSDPHMIGGWFVTGPLAPEILAEYASSKPERWIDWSIGKGTE